MPVPALPITRNLKRKSDQMGPKSGKSRQRETYRRKYGNQEAITVTGRETNTSRVVGNNNNRKFLYNVYHVPDTVLKFFTYINNSLYPRENSMRELY